MSGLVAAALGFLVLHRVISGSPVRDRIVAAVGERPFRGAFELASVAAVAWLGLAYAATSDEWRQPLWPTPSWTWSVQLAVQPLALFLMVTGFLSPNPTSVGQERAAETTEAVRGALRITRHPFLWGVALMAIGHMAATPSPRGLLLFGALLVVALTGTLSIDAKRSRALGERWTAYAEKTSNVPFAAVLDGRQPLRPAEFSARDVIVSAALSIAAALAHPAVRRALFS